MQDAKKKSPIYQFKIINPDRGNMKSLLWKIPNYILSEWLAFNYYTHLWCFKSKVSHPAGKAHRSRHLLRFLHTPDGVTMTCTMGDIQKTSNACASACTCNIAVCVGTAIARSAVYLICKGAPWSGSTVFAKVLYSSHNPKWQQQQPGRAPRARWLPLGNL